MVDVIEELVIIKESSAGNIITKSVKTIVIYVVHQFCVHQRLRSSIQKRKVVI